MKYQQSIVFTATALLLSTANASFAAEQVPELGQLEFDGAELVLPMKEQNGHPKVLVDMGDREEHLFIVDTGASVNVLDTAIAESLGLEVTGEMEIGAPGGPKIPGKIVTSPRAHVGAAMIEGAQFVTMDLARFSGGTMQGVLGLGLFKNYLLTYDYGQGEIHVSRESLLADEAGVMPYDDVDGQIQIEVDVAGTILATHVDTGSMAGFTLPIEMKESLKIAPTGHSAATARLVGGNRDIQIAQLDGDIRFAGSLFKDPDVGFMNPSPGYGNIGSRVLSDYVVSIDQKNQLIRFKKSAPKMATTKADSPRRLGVQFRGIPGGSVLEIGHVEPDSLGEEAGLLAGDLLLKLNGKPSEEYDMRSLGALIRGDEPLKMEVNRDGTTKIIEIL